MPIILGLLLKFVIIDCMNSPDESVDVCSCCGAEPLAVGTNAVDKLEFANQLATQPS